MQVDWSKAPEEATHYDSKWDQWMWLDEDGDWLSYDDGVMISGWGICLPSKDLIESYFIERG